MKDLTDETHGNWTVLRFHKKHKPKLGCLKYLWWCRCKICNKESAVQQTKLLSGLTSRCKKCYIKDMERPPQNPKWLEEELKWLRTLEIDDVMRLTGRTRQAVIMKRYKMNYHHGFENKVRT